MPCCPSSSSSKKGAFLFEIVQSTVRALLPANDCVICHRPHPHSRQINIDGKQCWCRRSVRQTQTAIVSRRPRQQKAATLAVAVGCAIDARQAALAAIHANHALSPMTGRIVNGPVGVCARV